MPSYLATLSTVTEVTREAIEVKILTSEIDIQETWKAEGQIRQRK